MAVPLMELKGDDQLRTTFFSTNGHGMAQDVVFFKVLSVKPDLKAPMIVDASKTKVILQV